jgi:hypothetical protein
MLADPNLDEEQRVHLTSIVGGEMVAGVEAALEVAQVKHDHGLPKDPSPNSGGEASTSAPQD